MALVTDTYTEASNTALGSHTPTRGTSWTVTLGSIQVNGTNDWAEELSDTIGNRARMNDDLGSDEMDVQADIAITGAAVSCFPGVFGRCTSGGNAGAYHFTYDVDVAGWVLDDGTTSDTVSETKPSGTKTYKLTIRDNDQKGYVDGAQKCALTTNVGTGQNYAGIVLGNFGSGASGTTQMNLDNFSAEGIGEAYIRTSTTTSGTSATSAPVINLPATVNAGDTILVLFRSATGGAVGWPSGSWNELADASDGSGDQYAAAWLKATGTEGGTTITLASGSGRFAGISYAFGGAADPNTSPPEINTVATGSGAAQPDSSSLTPSGGSKMYMWGSWYSMQGEQTAVSSYPTGYSLGNHFETSGTAGVASGNVTTGAGWKLATGTSDDPGAWSVSGTLDQWAAFTFAIYPYVAPAPGAAGAGRISLLGVGL